ncbi:MAG: hypothetical protein H7Y27_05605 [Gemmatimonadaceae bacterium]|nr:hypothetical protein [Chitinophagaceae bacterium]
MMHKFLVALVSFFLLITVGASAQDTIRTAGGDSTQFFELIHSDRLRFLRVDSVTELQMLAGGVIVKQDKTTFYCDSAVINKRLKILEAFGKVYINDADSIKIYSNYLIYHLDTKIAVLKKNVRLTDGKGTLTTEELEYDTRSKIGDYRKGGKVVNGTTVLTSAEATYYGDLHDVIFKKNVKMRDPKTNLDTDSLLYNTDSQVATFIAKTQITDSAGGTVVTTDGFYDMKNRRASFGKRSVIKDGKGITVTGDDIFTDDATGRTVIRGSGVFRDSVQNVAIVANYMESDRKKNTILATQHPLMIIKQDEDSIYVTADTLYSAPMKGFVDSNYRDIPLDTLRGTRVLNTNDTSDIRFFQCYHNVRIFSDSLQAVCDSLFYSARDSVFRLFNEPIVWASLNQVTGDTIYLFTKDRKAERMSVFENGMVINKAYENMFNQIRGNTLNGYFRDGVIDYMRAKGSAQSIYYAKDENDALVGVNNASADIIDMRFDNKELDKVIFISEVTGTMYPVSQLPEDKKQLRNFRWQENRRPKTKFELFENPQASKQ